MSKPRPRNLARPQAGRAEVPQPAGHISAAGASISVDPADASGARLTGAQLSEPRLSEPQPNELQPSEERLSGLRSVKRRMGPTSNESQTARRGAGTRTDKTRKPRVQFVDLLRLLASFQMVHGHTMDSVLADHLREGVVYHRWTFMRGTVSIGFMFAAGISFYMSTLPKFEEHKNNPKAVGRRFRRFFDLMAIGYLLHFPGAAFSGDQVAAEAAWHAFFAVDVLQCIGTGIVTLQLMTMAFKKRQHVVYAAAVLSTLMFVLAPLADQISPDGPFRFLLNYLTHSGGSQFPLLPWTGYIFAGVVVGAFLLPNGVKSDVAPIFPRMLGLTIGVFALATLVDHSPWSFVTPETHAASRPAFALFKFGVTCSIVTVLAFIGQHIKRLPRMFEILAGESLIVYVSHLVVLYGFGIGVHHWLGHRLEFGEAMLVAFMMWPVTGVISLWWPRFRTWRLSRAERRAAARRLRVDQDPDHRRRVA